MQRLFFSYILQNLDTRYSNNKLFIDNLKDSSLKVIRKYRNQPSIAVIRKKCINTASFVLLKPTKKKLNI